MDLKQARLDFIQNHLQPFIDNPSLRAIGTETLIELKEKQLNALTSLSQKKLYN